MKSIEEFKAFYESDLVGVLTEMDKSRKKSMKKVILLILIIVIGGVIALLFSAYNFPEVYSIVVGAAVIITAIILGIKLNKERKITKKEYKQKVMRPIVHFIDDSLNYQPTSFISKSQFSESKIFTQRIDRYKGDDLIEGTIGKTDIRFSEVHAEYYTTDKDGKRHYHTIFKGIFLIADFHKDFSGETYVLVDTAEKLFGKLGKVFQKANFIRPKLVKMEDPVFEKAFVVYGSDQIESRYILTPAMMERMMNLKKKSDRVQFSFKNSQVYIALPVKKNLFEAPLFKSMLNFDVIQEYYEYLLLAIGVVEDLDLNTRIWTKE